MTEQESTSQKRSLFDNHVKRTSAPAQQAFTQPVWILHNMTTTLPTTHHEKDTQRTP